MKQDFERSTQFNKCERGTHPSKAFGWLAKAARFANLDDQVEAYRRVFASDTRWTVVRGSSLDPSP
jgi:hypothetical protein